MLLVGVIIGPVVYSMTFIPMGIAFYLLLMLIGVFLFVRMPVSESFIIAEAAPEIQSTVLGIYFFAGSLGGGMLTPLMGVLVDHFSFRQSFQYAGIFLMLLSAVCSLLIFIFNKKIRATESETA
jgi:predicted MFS family arabinose efflux permease